MTTSAVAAKPAASPWLTAIYAAVFTAIITAAFVWFFGAGMLILWILALLLIGAGPVLGYQMATGRLGGDWKSILSGILGFVLAPLSFLLWPILVGAMTKGQSIGKLLLWSVIGFIVGVVVWFVIGTLFGQDPVWVGPAWIVAWAVWGAFAGAAMLSGKN